MQRLLIDIAQRWEESPECVRLVEEWIREGREIAWAYFHGPVRGLDTWESWGAFVTIGDPWPELGAAARDAEGADLENPNEWLIQSVRDELAQGHGRARDPQRTTPCDHLHLGQIPPGFWNDENATVIAPPPGLSAEAGASRIFGGCIQRTSPNPASPGL